MNNIHEKDWAAGCWSGHTGMDSCSDYCDVESETNNQKPIPPTALAEEDKAAPKE